MPRRPEAYPRGSMERGWGGGGWLWLALLVMLGAAAAYAAQADPQVQEARIKDVATIEGIRDNQLVGFGLVVGLKGTGDSSQTVFPAQTLVSTLERLGITVPQTGSNSASNMQVKNMAAVFVVATLPPFSRPGEKMDITVSSAGDARSLEGGILLMTPLYGPDGMIYAQAQGALVLGGYIATSAGNTRQMNHPTTARIPGGALVERAVPFELKQMHTVTVVLMTLIFTPLSAWPRRSIVLWAPRGRMRWTVAEWRWRARKARTLRRCSTGWRRWRWKSIRGRGWW